MILNDVYKNCKFKAVYDEDNERLHILDLMGDKAYKSVTNAIDELVPYVIYQLGIKVKVIHSNVLCYGTDGLIAEYNPITTQFQFVHKYAEKVNDTLRKEMEKIYNY